jgi:hypothetical protein
MRPARALSGAAETCLWNALKIQDFPVLDVAGRVTTPPCGTEDGTRRKERNLCGIKGRRFGLY